MPSHRPSQKLSIGSFGSKFNSLPPVGVPTRFYDISATLASNMHEYGVEHVSLVSIMREFGVEHVSLASIMREYGVEHMNLASNT